MAIKVPFQPQYEPTSVLGFDLNKSLDNWLVFNTGDVIRGDESVERYIKEIRELILAQTLEYVLFAKFLHFVCIPYSYSLK